MFTLSGTPDFTPCGEFMISLIHYTTGADPGGGGPGPPLSESLGTCIDFYKIQVYTFIVASEKKNTRGGGGAILNPTRGGGGCNSKS